MTLIGYMMTHDSGFAPNPFWGILTLATCKPVIRRTKIIGDWVAGFASKALVNKSKNEGVTVPYQGLIYLMKIGEVMTLDAYFNDPRFKIKKPCKNHPDPIKRCGDNIYYWVDGKPRQLPNNSHNLKSIERDTRGVNVLIANMKESYYFGRECPIPDGGWESIGFIFSKGRTFNCSSYLENIRDFLRNNGYNPDVHGNPCLRVDQEDASTHVDSCSKQ
jgi:hypothetical protein